MTPDRASASLRFSCRAALWFLGSVLANALPATLLAQAASPTVTVTKTTDAPGTRKSQGDTIAYTVTIANTGSLAATGVELTDPTPTGTALVGGSVKVTPLAIDDVYGVLGNTQRIVSAAAGVLANDVDPDDGTAFENGRLSVKTGSVTRVTGANSTVTGALTLNADGSFTYTPPVNAASGSERFSYIVVDSDNQDSVSVGYIDFTLSGRVIYVKNGGTGDGRSHSPLGSPSTASTNATAASDIIYVLSEAGTLSGAFTLDNGQQLLGQGVALTATLNTNGASAPITFFAAGTTPTIANSGGTAITLNSAGSSATNTLQGFSIGAAATAIAGTNFGTATINGIAINNPSGGALNLTTGTLAGTGFTSITSTNTSGRNIALTGIATSGTFALGSGALSGSSGTRFYVSGGTGSFSYSGTITATGANSPVVEVVGSKTSGTITLSGNLTAGTSGSPLASSGVIINPGNAATVVNLTGAITLHTSTGAAFTASSGTFSANNVNNVLSTTTGVALNVSNATVGASGLVFKSVSANGAPNGIVFSNTGSNAGLTILGDGGVTNNGSGGVIQNTSGAGIVISNARGVTLNQMTVTNSGTDGVNVSTINGLTITRCTITDNGGAATDQGIQIGDFATGTAVNGTITISNTTVTRSPHDNLAVGIASGTSTWAISGCTFSLSGTGGTNYATTAGNNGVNVEIRGSAIVSSFNFSNNTVSGNYADGLQIAPASGTTGSLTATISSNNFSNNGIGLDLAALGAANMTYTVSGNTIVSANRRATSGIDGTSHAVNVFQGTTSTGTLNFRFDGNTIGSSANAGSGSSLGNGLRVNFNDGGQGRVVINNNTIRECPVGRGIEVIGRNGNGQLDVTITNNDVNHVNTGFLPGTSDFPLAAIYVQSHETALSAPTHYTVRSDIRANTVPSGAASEVVASYLIVLESQASGSTSNHQLVNTSGAASATVQLTNTNFGLGAANAGVSLIAGPINTPPLLLGTGGVERAETPATYVAAATGSSITASETNAAVVVPSTLPTEVSAVSSTLTQTALDAVVRIALTRWEATSLTAEQSALLHELRFEVASLSGYRLGEAAGSRVLVDDDAGGHGWFIDAEGQSESAFAQSVSSTRHYTDSAGDPAGRIDLLTAVMHEMGHALGLEDSYAATDRDNLMYGYLTKGERRLPFQGQAKGAVPSADVTHFLSAPIAIGTLPAGKSVVVTFQVTIGARANVSSQASVSGSNFSTVTSSNVTTNVQQAPALSAVAKSGNEDAAITFAASDFTSNFVDPNSDSLATVTIVSLPVNGTLKLGENNVSVSAVIAAGDLGSITYTPTADFHGSDSFTWNATDNYATEPLSAAVGAAVNITISPIAEPPSITSATTAEDTQSTDGLVVTRSTADGAEVTHFKITDISGGSLYQNDGTTLIANGDFITFAQAEAGLKFTPSADLNSGASDTFEFAIAGATDSSGTGLGSATTATITVTEVNDTPVPSTDTLSSFDEDSGPWTIPAADLIANDSTGPANESGQTLRISGVTDADGGTVELSGTDVIFTPTLNFSGTATFQYTVEDNGTTNSAADAKTATGSVSFTVTGVNDSPSVTAPATLNGAPNTALKITGVSFADVDAAASAVAATFSAPSGTFVATSSGGVSVTGSGTATIVLGGTVAQLNAFIAAENLTFTAAADTTVNVTIDDEGFTGTGGDKTATAEIEIVLNRAPVAGFGGALLVEKSGDEGVEVSHNAALNLGTGSFTIEAWFKRASAVDGFYTIVGKQGGAGGAGFYLRFNTDKLSFAVGTSANANWVDGNLSINDTSWHHVAAVLDTSAETLAIYVDGVLDRSASFATAKSVDNAAALGLGFKPGYGENFDGALDEVRIWNTARSASQIVEYMRAPLSGAEAGLVGYWNFEGLGAAVANTTATAGLDGIIQSAGGTAERIAGGIDYTTSVAEDSTGNVLRIGGNDVEDNATTVAKITALPTHGTLFHADGITEITSASAGSPVAVVDAGGAPQRVIYVPEANYVGADSFGYIVNDGTLDSANTQTVNITVTNVNDAPVFTSGTTFSVSENAANSTAVGDVNAHDGDGGANDAGLTYSITGGTGESLFSISSSTGAITVNATGASTLNYEAAQSYTLTVRADDGAASSNTADQSITITITDSAPAVTASQSFSIAENSANGTALGGVALTGDTDSITWSIESGNTGGAFAINSSTGQLTVASSVALNYESVTSFSLSVRATDATTNSDQVVTVNLTNVNEAPSITSGATASFNENATGTVYTAAGSDPDASSTLTFTLGGTDAADFAIDANTGAVTFVATPNYESPADADTNNVYHITVTASDGTLTSTAHAVAITVTNVNEAPSVTSAAAVNTAENQAGAYTVTGSDPDASTTLTYAIAGGDDASLFTIAPSTGVVSFVVAADFELPDDADENNVYRITVTASDGTLTSSAQAVEITVTDAADAPIVTSGAAVSVGENQTSAYTITATDQDSGSTLTYAIAGTDAAKFTIDANTGVVIFASAPNFEAPDDADTNNVYNVTVTASDGALTSSAHAVAITVTNVNETPSVTSSTAADAAENQTAAYTVTGSDPDASTTLTFAISGGADAALFAINPNSGVVSFSSAPNFESFGDADTDGVYEIEVTATDGTLTSASAAVAITVTDAPDAPTVTSAASANAAENQTTAYTVTGSDADAATTFTYAITGGADAALFTIDPTTGAVTFNSAPNFEDPSDAGTNNVYNITVTASDGALTSADHAVAITLTNVNEAPSITSGATASFNENATGTVYTATGSDPDASSTLTFTLGGTDAADFAINENTGAVTFVATPNYESPADADANNVYHITVTASDGTLTSTAHAVAITVNNVNEAPTITSGATASFSEHATGTVYTATGSDVDASTTLTFSLGGTDAADFSIDASTGAVTFVSAPNFEAPADGDTNNVYNLTVTASDGTLTSTAQAVAITVTNVNETPSVTSASAVNAAENQSVAYTVTGSDPDASTTLSYAIAGGEDAALFTIDSSSGVVSFVVAPDYELPDDANENNVYRITVTASDGTLTSSAQAVDITVTDAADAPVVTSGSAVSVAENQTSAYTVTGTDQDSDSALSYALAGPDAAKFTIDGATGVVTFSSAPNFEAPADAGADNIYNITVTANDGVLTSAAHDVAITVTNVNETPSVTSSATANASENQTTAYTVTGSDPDASTTLTFAISGGVDASLFTIETTSGVVSFNSAPNFESLADGDANGVYEIEVTTTDGTLTSAPLAVAITVTDAAEAPTVTSATTGNAAENQTAAYTVTGNDADAGTTFVYAISGGADAALFAINPSTGAVTFNSAPNYEAPSDAGTNNVYNISVTVSDGTLTSGDHAVAITVTNVNETPTVTSDGAATFAENATGTVYTATGTDPDASTTLTFALGGADAALFAISANTGVVTFVASPNFESPADADTDNTYNFTVTASDGTLTSAAQAVAVAVTDANDAPTNLTLSANSLNQSQSTDADVGTLTTTDEDGGETFTYSLVSGAGSGDNASFNLSGDKLRANEPAALAPRSYSVRIQTTDSANATFEKVFSIVVTDDVSPTITSIAGPAAGVYGIGQTLEFSVTFTEPVTVTTTGGMPVLNLTIGEGSRAALYAEGSATMTLVFRYVVQAGDSTADGALTAVSLALEGGTIKDANDNDASLTFGAKIFADVIIEARFHSADTNHDWHLSLFELTRVIELYNTRSGTERTGEYHSTADTEDGFGFGPGVIVGHHSADANEDGRIDLSELTRVIELYNTRDGTTRTGEYHRSLDTEDGFATGPESRR